jgi:hypothetical protein
MPRFCTCGSILITGNCSNKKCRHHIPDIDPATFSQIEFIKSMLEQLGIPEAPYQDPEYDYRKMDIKQASKLIDELQSRLEVMK